MYVRMCRAHGKELMIQCERPRYLLGKKFIEDIGDCTFGQVMECNLLLKKQDFEVIPDLVAVIYEVEKSKVEQAPVTDIYPVAVHIIEDLARLNKIHEKAAEMELKSEEIEAGAEVFEKYGMFNTIDSLAHGQIWMHSEIENLQFYHVVNKIQKNRDEALYNERLSKVMERKFKKK